MSETQLKSRPISRSDYDYADKWVTAALTSAKTSFTSGNGDADFSQYTENSARAEAATKGSAFLTTWMFAVGMLETSIVHCKAGDKAASLAAWDKGVALYTGSLEGESGISQGGSSFGELTYALAEKQCAQFKTCGATGDALTGGARANAEALALFETGKRHLDNARCDPMRSLVYNIIAQMNVPLVQGLLRSAYLIGSLTDVSNKQRAEGATYAAALLPQIAYCDQKNARADAPVIYEQMRLGAGQTNFATVKQALESNYQCLKISCVEVGGVWDTGANDYVFGITGQPCKDLAKEAKAGEAVGFEHA